MVRKRPRSSSRTSRFHLALAGGSRRPKASSRSPDSTTSSRAPPLTGSSSRTPSPAKSLRVMIGFGVNEDPMFRREFSQRGNTMQLSGTVYWYQPEPHAPLPQMPPANEHAPAPEQAFWPDKETIFAERGYGTAATKGYAWISDSRSPLSRSEIFELKSSISNPRPPSPLSPPSARPPHLGAR
jgi:hypothetical protein